MAVGSPSCLDLCRQLRVDLEWRVFPYPSFMAGFLGLLGWRKSEGRASVHVGVNIVLPLLPGLSQGLLGRQDPRAHTFQLFASCFSM
jgi:hypothetical protein